MECVWRKENLYDGNRDTVSHLTYRRYTLQPNEPNTPRGGIWRRNVGREETQMVEGTKVPTKEKTSGSGVVTQFSVEPSIISDKGINP